MRSVKRQTRLNDAKSQLQQFAYGSATSKRGQFTGAAEVGGNYGQQFVGGEAADTRDTFEQFYVSSKRGILAGVGVDNSFDRFDLLVQIGDYRLERVFYGTIQAGLLPVLPLFEVFKSPDQRQALVATFALLVSEQDHVEAGLTDVNLKYHLASHPLSSNAPWASLVHAGSRRCGSKIPSDLEREKGDLISFSSCKPVL